MLDEHLLADSLLCAMWCLFIRTCKSYSVCYDTKCQLYSIDKFDINYTNGSISDNSCTLYSMKSYNQPKCIEKGVLKSIQDDISPANCNINLKRTDAVEVWSSSVSLIAATEEYRIYYKSICMSEAFHGGKHCSHIDKIDEQILWRSESATWFGAQTECESLGGHLFDSLKGSRAQLQLLSQYLNYSLFWLGISDEKHEGVWTNMRGEDMTEFIFWRLSQPDGGTRQNYLNFDGTNLISNPDNVNCFNDVGPLATYKFPCQLYPWNSNCKYGISYVIILQSKVIIQIEVPNLFITAIKFWE